MNTVICENPIKTYIEDLTEVIGLFQDGEEFDFTDEVSQIINFLKGLQKNMGTEQAHNIIDLVEYAIRKAHPRIEAIAQEKEENTLLIGENYYDLENRIVEEIETDYGYCDNCDGNR